MGIREVYDLSKSDNHIAIELGLEPDPLPPCLGFFIYHFISPLMEGLLRPHCHLGLHPIQPAPETPPHPLFQPLIAPSICLASFYHRAFAHAVSPSKNIVLCSLPRQSLLSLLAQCQTLLLGLLPPLKSLVLTPDQMGSATFPECCYHLS